MKLITAIINKRDSGEVCHSLSEAGFYFTKIATSGGFLSTGNVTLLIGTEDEKVEGALDIIRKNSAQRIMKCSKTSFKEFITLSNSSVQM